jgi:hypothetical protein
MDDWWAELEGDVLACLKTTGAMPPAEVGRRLGLSESAAASVLAMLAREGKVRITLVEPVAEPRS